MVEYLICGENKSNIAKLLNISRQTVYAWLELDEVKEYKAKRLEEIKKDAKSKIATRVNTCLDEIYNIAIKSKDMRTKFAAAKYICDQFIGVPTKEKEEPEQRTITVDVVD